MNLNIEPIHIVVVLDESGSMGGSQKQVVESFNSIITTYREKFGNEAYVSLYKFGGSTVTTVYKSRHLAEVVDMTIADFVPAGGTPMYDGVGLALEDHAAYKRVFFVVDTDGYENTSREYNSDTIKKLVEQRTEAGWDFTFVGADLSKEAVVNMGSTMGLQASSAMAFDKSDMGYTSRSFALSAKLDNYTKMAEANPLPSTDTE